MKNVTIEFTPAHVDIDLPDDLTTEELRAWVIRKIEEIDIQRKEFQQILQRYANTAPGRKQYTPEQLAVIHAERGVLYEQRTAYRKLLGDLNAQQKLCAQIDNNQKESRQFSQVFMDVARQMLSAQEFNRLFAETRKRTAQA